MIVLVTASIQAGKGDFMEAAMMTQKSGTRLGYEFHHFEGRSLDLLKQHAIESALEKWPLAKSFIFADADVLLLNALPAPAPRQVLYALEPIRNPLSNAYNFLFSGVQYRQRLAVRPELVHLNSGLVHADRVTMTSLVREWTRVQSEFYALNSASRAITTMKLRDALDQAPLACALLDDAFEPVPSLNVAFPRNAVANRSLRNLYHAVHYSALEGAANKTAAMRQQWQADPLDTDLVPIPDHTP